MEVGKSVRCSGCGTFLRSYQSRNSSKTVRQRACGTYAPERRKLRNLAISAEGQNYSSAALEDSEDELADQMEEFLRSQAEQESGGALAKAEEKPQKVLGKDVVSDDDAKRYCREVMGAIKQLRKTRDMSINEIKLTVAIEDPTVRDNRDYLGIEEDAGVSRDEVAAALLDVAAGRIPLDRLALKELHRDVLSWPFLRSGDEEIQAEQKATANYEGITDTGVKQSLSGGWRSGQARPPVGRDKEETPQSLTDMLPEWMGYGFLYFVSIIPVLIVITTVSILFFSSLK